MTFRESLEAAFGPDRVYASVPLAGYTTFRVNRATLGADASKSAITTAVNGGQLLVNFSGHGSVQLWGRDGELLTPTDVTTLWRNATRLPFVVAMNCLNGLFTQIWDEESLAESLQRAPDQGAVAVWASSAVTSAARGQASSVPSIGTPSGSRKPIE